MGLATVPDFKITKPVKRTQIQNLKLVQILTDPKRTFPSLKCLKSNMGMKDLKKGTNFSIRTSSDSKWISNKKSEKLLKLEFNRIY
jgi:hypothetical protein